MRLMEDAVEQDRGTAFRHSPLVKPDVVDPQLFWHLLDDLLPVQEDVGGDLERLERLASEGGELLRPLAERDVLGARVNALACGKSGGVR